MPDNATLVVGISFGLFCVFIVCMYTLLSILERICRELERMNSNKEKEMTSDTSRDLHRK